MEKGNKRAVSCLLVLTLQKAAIWFRDSRVLTAWRECWRHDCCPVPPWFSLRTWVFSGQLSGESVRREGSHTSSVGARASLCSQHASLLCGSAWPSQLQSSGNKERAQESESFPLSGLRERAQVRAVVLRSHSRKQDEHARAGLPNPCPGARSSPFCTTQELGMVLCPWANRTTQQVKATVPEPPESTSWKERTYNHKLGAFEDFVSRILGVLDGHMAF